MIRAYHFVGKTLRDGRPVPPDGEWLEHDGPIVMCQSGLHASRHPFDALRYAPGATLCLVDCDGDVEEDTDKLVCRRRRIVARIDATDLLLAFAREQALGVVHLWDAPEVVVRYLQTGDETIRATADAAAWFAALAAADAAAWYAALAAADAAADAAAWSAALAAALAAARAAAYAAARADAYAAARADAGAAAWSAAKDRLAALVAERLP